MQLDDSIVTETIIIIRPKTLHVVPSLYTVDQSGIVTLYEDLGALARAEAPHV